MDGTAILIGGGAVGVDFHLPRLLGICAARRVSVVEPEPARRQQLAERFRGRDDVELLAELPDTGRFAIGVIAAPPRFHADYVLRLHERCALLVIEKPLARNLAEAEAIAARLAVSPARAVVCHIRRTLSSFRQARAIIAGGLLGALEAVTLHEGGVFAWRAASLGSFSRELNGGGVLLDTGPHTIDLLLQVFAHLELERAWMDAGMQRPGRAIEANCVLELRAGEVPIEVTLSRNRRLSNKARFRFARGELTVDVRDNTMALTASGLHLAGVGGEGAVPMAFADLFDAFYRRFVVADDTEGVAPTDAVRGMRLIEQAYRQAQPIEQGF